MSWFSIGNGINLVIYCQFLRPIKFELLTLFPSSWCHFGKLSHFLFIWGLVFALYLRNNPWFWNLSSLPSMFHWQNMICYFWHQIKTAAPTQLTNENVSTSTQFISHLTLIERVPLISQSSHNIHNCPWSCVKFTVWI